MGEKGLKEGEKKSWQKEWKSSWSWCGFIRHLQLHLPSYRQKAVWEMTTCSVNLSKFDLFFTILILLDSSTMRETNGRRKYDLTVVPCMIYLDKQTGQYATSKVL